MTKRQAGQRLGEREITDLGRGDPHALVEQKLVSAQNYVVGQRAAYQRALAHRARSSPWRTRRAGRCTGSPSGWDHPLRRGRGVGAAGAEPGGVSEGRGR